MLSKRSVCRSHPILVFLAPVTRSRPSKSPHRGTFTFFSTLSRLADSSSAEAPGGTGGHHQECTLSLGNPQYIPGTGQHQSVCSGCKGQLGDQSQ